MLTSIMMRSMYVESDRSRETSYDEVMIARISDVLSKYALSRSNCLRDAKP